MVVKVKGMKAARTAAAIMEHHTGRETGIHRGEDNDRLYWVSNTYLEPAGEQEVLDRLPRETLLYCAGCSHQRPKPGPLRNRGVLSERTKEKLRELAHDISVSQGLRDV